MGLVQDPELNMEQLTKDAINAVIGLWSAPTHHVYAVETSTCTADLFRTGFCRKRAVPNHEPQHD